MTLPDYTSFSEKVKLLAALVKKLPKTIPIGTKTDRINEVFTNIPVPPKERGEEHWPVFNRRLDVLFGENLWDSNGRLPNIQRGEFGMDMVVKYIREATEAGFLLWDAGMPKVERREPMTNLQWRDQ